MRLFYAALVQSSVGTGAAYVALMLLAYERYRSPWAISLILLADFLPAMLLGPVLGGAADRWSRRWCVVGADLLRAAAFVGIAFTGSFALTVVFALLAGTGTALFRPAALAALPSLVAPGDVSRVTALFSAVSQVGWTIGPAFAAGALLVSSAETITAVNGATFLVSAVVLLTLPLDKGRSQQRDDPAPMSLFRSGLEGWKSVVALVDLRIVVLASGAAMFFGGIFNVAEPLFATQTLAAGEAGYSILVAIYGLGFIVGSLAASAGGKPAVLRLRYLQGLFITGIGSLVIAVSPNLVAALAPFALAGAGNGVVVVYERLLIQSRVPESVYGRAFVLTETLVAWALAIAFIAAGVISSFAGPRELIYIVATGELLLALVVALAIRANRTEVDGEIEPVGATGPGR